MSIKYIEINLIFFLCILQEVGSIIGKKGEIVNRFREEVSILTVDFETLHFIIERFGSYAFNL